MFSCSKEKKRTISITKESKKTIVSKKIPIPNLKKKIVKKEDSLNNLNVIPFFTEYGKQHKETKVLFKTRLGEITIKLYNDTPIHRANFIFLTKIGYFSTTCFHRVVPYFIAQGGDSEYTKTAQIRAKYKNYTLPPEFRKNRKHKRGSIAAARDWENNPKKLSTPFEFYFIQNPKGEHHLNYEHTVFGEVIKGMGVIDKIINVEADKDQWPFKDVYIEAQVIQ